MGSKQPGVQLKMISDFHVASVRPRLIGGQGLVADWQGGPLNVVLK